MNTGVQTIHKKDIARQQLETAVFLFLKNIDYPSVITLSGAAGNILRQLVLNEGKRPFVDLGRHFVNFICGEHLPREKYRRRMELLFGIPELKHMSEVCEDEVEIDLEGCALNSLIVGVTDYITLEGQEEPFIKAFLSWCWVNKNGPEVLEFYKNLPEKLKK